MLVVSVLVGTCLREGRESLECQGSRRSDGFLWLSFLHLHSVLLSPGIRSTHYIADNAEEATVECCRQCIDTTTRIGGFVRGFYKVRPVLHSSVVAN